MDVGSENELSHFVQALPDGSGPFLVQDTSFFDDPDGRPPRVRGVCRDLRALGIACSGIQKATDLPPRTRKILSAVLYDDGLKKITVDSGPVDPKESSGSGPSTLVIAGGTEGVLGLSEAKRIACRAMSDPPEISDLAEGRYGNSTSNAHQGLWIVLFGFGTVLILGLALGTTAATRFRDQADALGPLTIVTGRRGPFWGIGAWTVAVPMVLGAWVALGVSWIVLAPMTTVPDGPSISGPLQIIAPGSLTVIALLTWVYVSANTIRSLRTWKPRST